MLDTKGWAADRWLNEAVQRSSLKAARYRFGMTRGGTGAPSRRPRRHL